MRKCAVVLCMLAFAASPAGANDDKPHWQLYTPPTPFLTHPQDKCEDARVNTVTNMIDTVNDNITGEPFTQLRRYMLHEQKRCCLQQDMSICVDAETYYQQQMTALWRWLSLACTPVTSVEDFVNTYHRYVAVPVSCPGMW